MLTVSSFFIHCFGCESNVSGTAEQICAKFTEKTCLILSSDEFERQGQKSKVKVTRNKKRAVHSNHPRQRRDGTRSLQITSRSSRRQHSVAARVVISGTCVRFMFGKTSLALVLFFFVGRPFVKRFALCYRSVVCLSLLSCLVLSCLVSGVGVLWPNGWMDQDETWHAGLQVGLVPGHNTLDGDQPTPPPKGHSPQFSAHICCGQMAGWIKLPLGMEVSLSPGDFALDGDPAPPQKGGGAPPNQQLISVERYILFSL